MWVLENDTPFAAERTWVRDKNGAEIWLVAIRATFNVFPDGAMEISEKQDKACMVPEYSGEPGQSSLIYESDLHHTKTRTDIILHGHAYAPKDKYATQTDVTLQVGNLSKKLRVFGDRFWDNGLSGMKMTRPEPFSKLPIIYERAYGGSDTKSERSEKHGWEPRNPIGKGFAMDAKHLEGEKLPNVEYPNNLISSWKHRPPPAGFGPIAGNWQPRLQFAGTYDKKWEEERQPLLPEDFDEQYYQCAPRDQQIDGFLQGGERVVLQNLTPEGFLKFQLPTATFDFETQFTNETVTHTADLHTVIIEPDHHRLIMIWHTKLSCHFKVLKLERTIIADRGISIPCCS